MIIRRSAEWAIIQRLNYLQTIRKLVSAALALAALAYIVLVAINWNDQPPSPLAKEFSASIDSRAVIPNSNNAFLYMMGFAGAPNIDPAELGVKRHEWYLQQLANNNTTLGNDPFDDDFDLRPGRSTEVGTLADDCQSVGANCLDLAAVKTLVATDWLDEEAWLLNRYIKLITHTQFSEPIPAGAFWLSPNFSRLGYGQKLLMVSALVSARNGDRSHVIALLEADSKFWRMILANSDILITKMIATAYVRNHFLEGSRVLEELHKTNRVDTIPNGWFEAINTAERSMTRSLVGEWRFIENAIQSTASGSWYVPTTSGVDGPTILERLTWHALIPLFQPQDISNQVAARIADSIETFDIPYTDIPAALTRSKNTVDDLHAPFSRAYNLAGDLRFPMSLDYGTYFARVADLEGVRRAALVTSQMRELGISAASVPSHLARSSITNPYTEKPLEWNAETNEVVFHGLQEYGRGTHRIQY